MTLRRLIVGVGSFGIHNLLMTGKYGNRSFSRIKISPSITGNNAYIVWFTDKGTLDSNCELIFKGWWGRNQTAEEPVVRLSSDNGATFGVKYTVGAKYIRKNLLKNK